MLAIDLIAHIEGCQHADRCICINQAACSVDSEYLLIKLSWVQSSTSQFHVQHETCTGPLAAVSAQAVLMILWCCAGMLAGNHSQAVLQRDHLQGDSQGPWEAGEQRFQRPVAARPLLHPPHDLCGKLPRPAIMPPPPSPPPVTSAGAGVPL